MGVQFGDFSPRISWTFSFASACYFAGGTAGQGCSQPASFHQQLYVYALQPLFVFISEKVGKQGGYKGQKNTVQGTIAKNGRGCTTPL